MKRGSSQSNAVTLGEVQSLIANAQSPDSIIRPASLQAARQLSDLYASDDPVAKAIRREIAKISDLHPGAIHLYEPTEEQKLRARSILSPLKVEVGFKAAHLYRTTAHQIANRPLPLFFKRPIDLEIKSLASRLPELSLLNKLEDMGPDLKNAKPFLKSRLSTLLFTHLASAPDKISSDDVYRVRKLVRMLGDDFDPDVKALLEAYKLFFPAGWAQRMEVESELPSEPVQVDPNDAMRGIEETIAGAGMKSLLEGLQGALISPQPADRWAAAELIGRSAYTLNHKDEMFASAIGGTANLKASTVSVGGDAIIHIGRTAGDSGVPDDDGSEPGRYTDLTLYKDYWYKGDNPGQDNRINEDLPLVYNRDDEYTLEVALRAKRTGIGAHQEARRSVLNPRRDRETVKIYILVLPLGKIDLENRFLWVDWPYDKDSERAFFQFKLKQERQEAIGREVIQVRLYDASLDLLDIVDLSLNIVEAHVPSGSEDLEPKVTWPDAESDFSFSRHPVSRLLSIDVRPLTDDFELTFKLLDNTTSKVVIPSSIRITKEDINALLRSLRKFWTQLVIESPYSTNLSVSKGTGDEILIELRQLGISAWKLLFGNKFPDVGTSETLGKLLAGLDTPDGGILQIGYTGKRDFIFPWSIVHPPTNDAVIDAKKFWGIRYQIEQVLPGPRDCNLSEEPISAVFTLDSHFDHAANQKALWTSYGQRSNGKLKVTDPLSQSDKLIEQLSTDTAAHLYYFYCHGYAPAEDGPLRLEVVNALSKLIEKLKEGSPERKVWDRLLSLTKFMKDEAWMFIGDAEIKESELKRHESFFQRRRPIVFLNMCQSAALVPTLTSGLVRLFLDRSASSVIGTECPINSLFADCFAKEVLDHLFTGKGVGEALQAARGHFIDKMNNPLGLAYTLYGRSTVKLGTSPIIQNQN